MRSPLAELDQDRLIEAMLPDVPFDGWSRATLRRAARRIDLPPDAAIALFPRGAPDLVAGFSRWADRRLLDRLAAAEPDGAGVSARIAQALRMRLDIVAPWREAVRRALPVLALPTNAPLGARLLYETVDGIWYAVGDTATDLSFYTKRATLAGIYAATLLYWLDDRSVGAADTDAFIARRLADTARIARARRRVSGAASRWPNPFRVMRPPG